MTRKQLISTIPITGKLYIANRGFSTDSASKYHNTFHRTIDKNEILLSTKTINDIEYVNIICYFCTKNGTKIKVTFPKNHNLDSQWILRL